MLYDIWMQTGSCQGIATSIRDFRKYRWFAIDRESFGGVGRTHVAYAGYHLSDSMAIYVSRKWMNDRGVLMHEITHALMYLKGEKMGHTFKRFGPFFCGLNYVDWKK